MARKLWKILLFNTSYHCLEKIFFGPIYAETIEFDSLSIFLIGYFQMLQYTNINRKESYNWFLLLVQLIQSKKVNI